MKIHKGNCLIQELKKKKKKDKLKLHFRKRLNIYDLTKMSAEALTFKTIM